MMTKASISTAFVIPDEVCARTFLPFIYCGHNDAWKGKQERNIEEKQVK